jgi:phosphinothricin acetyltransferase
VSASEFEVRIATLADLPRLTDIYNHYVLHTPVTFDIEPFSVEQRRSWFDQHREHGRHRLFVAADSGRVVAYVSSHQFRVKAAYDSTVETTVYCDPGFTRRGIGSTLYRVLFDALRDEDIAAYVAGITLPNEGSVALHAQFGFTPIGTMHRVGRKFDTYWDVGWYERLVK